MKFKLEWQGFASLSSKKTSVSFSLHIKSKNWFCSVHFKMGILSFCPQHDLQWQYWGRTIHSWSKEALIFTVWDPLVSIWSLLCFQPRKFSQYHIWISLVMCWSSNLRGMRFCHYCHVCLKVGCVDLISSVSDDFSTIIAQFFTIEELSTSSDSNFLTILLG